MSQHGSIQSLKSVNPSRIDSGRGLSRFSNKLYFTFGLIFILIVSGHSQVPSIVSFAPNSGPVGSSITITGTNFSAIPTANIVYFGTTKATVIGATSSSLTVTVPVGATYQPITVLTNGLLAYSNKPFIVTFACGGYINSSSFLAKTDFLTSNTPFGLATGDLDGDGKADVAVANVNSNSVSILRNNSISGGISFANKIDFATTNPYSVSIGDLDGDGNLDLISTTFSANTVSVFRNTSTVGSINFGSKVDLTAGQNPSHAAIGDLDADGLADLVVINNNAPSLSIFKNHSSIGIISFDPKQDYATGLEPYGISIGDLDLDGKPDLAVNNYSSNTVSIYRNTGSPGAISFAPKIDFATGAGPYSVNIGDLDLDGKPDLVVTNFTANTMSLFLNTSIIGAFSFAARIDFTTGIRPGNSSIGDVDGDGKPDLITSNETSNTISLFKNISNTGNLAFNAKMDLLAGTTPHKPSIADLDGDGKQDLMVINDGSSTISTYRNNQLCPTLISFTPTLGVVGTMVTLTGTNFDPVPANNTVNFNGTTSNVTISTSTSITTSVPVGATTGIISVTVNGLTANSPTNFTVTPIPTITGFNPSSGLVGSSVTITGTNFDLIPANNTAKFNGIAATVSASTSTTITVIVPASATSGPITVTVNGQTATSPTNFTVIVPIVIVNESFPSTYDRGGTLTMSITVNDVTNVSLVNLKTRGISEPLSASKTVTIAGTGTKFEKTIAGTDLTDEIGLSYYFEVMAIGQGVLQSSKSKSRIKYPSTSSEQVIPNMTFGNQVKNYQIISIPLELANNNGSAVLTSLGAVDKTKWRLFDYLGTDYIEYPAGFSTISTGKGYWLIVRNSTSINPGEGITVSADDTNPYVINLTTGWNLVGNPYNFRISWPEVLSLNNNPTGVGKLKVFNNGSLEESNTLDRYRGGFVFADAPFALKIPILRNTTLGGRVGEINQMVNTLDQSHWEVDLTLSAGELSNHLGGIGMDPSAKLQGKDRFDEVRVPLPQGFGLFDLSVPHPEVYAKFSKDIVPLQENFTWNFDIDRPTSGDLVLSWRNDYFGYSEKQLMLFDPSTLLLTDMKKTDHIALASGSTQVRVLFGSGEYIKHELDSELPWLGNAYPNPAHGQITIPFRVPEAYDQMPVLISIYNSQGVEVGAPINQTLSTGTYEVKWSPMGQTGLHIIRMRIGQQETKTMKVMFR